MIGRKGRLVRVGNFGTYFGRLGKIGKRCMIGRKGRLGRVGIFGIYFGRLGIFGI